MNPVHYQYIYLTIYVVLIASPKIYNVILNYMYCLSPRQIVKKFDQMNWEKNVTWYFQHCCKKYSLLL